ncbi:hypothetical protein B0H19DRAFT_894430, partial [Mycena capillaripes]
MSTQKRNEMLAKGLCFNCNEPGHLARNCPKNQTVPSKKKGKPPGMAAHAVHIPTASSSRDALRESTQVLEAFALRFGDLSEVEEGGEPLQTFDTSEHDFELVSGVDSQSENEPSCPPERSHRLGDVLGKTVAALLEFFQPYPGDERVPWADERRDSTRFRVLRPANNVYTIEDSYFDEVTILPLEYLRVPTFHLLEWYSRQRAMALEIEYIQALP